MADNIENNNENNNVDVDEEVEENAIGNIEQAEMAREMQQSFLEYSMSVIVARALPDVRDGLKPVHRRILYAMNESGYVPSKPHMKSARTVGDVIGKYHPHGDSAVFYACATSGRPRQLRLN